MPAFSELARYALRRYDIPPATISGAAEGVPDVSASARGVGDAPLPVQEGATTAPEGSDDDPSDDGDEG